MEYGGNEADWTPWCGLTLNISNGGTKVSSLSEQLILNSDLLTMFIRYIFFTFLHTEIQYKAQGRGLRRKLPTPRKVLMPQKRKGPTEIEEKETV